MLMTYHNYQERHVPAILIKSSTDTRDRNGKITSRAGLSEKADFVIQSDEDENWVDVFFTVEKIRATALAANAKAVMLDEAQFFGTEFLKELLDSFRDLDVHILFYGLMTDFTGHLFPASTFLIENVDSLREIETQCAFCERKATHNLRVSNDHVVTTGNEIAVGSDNYLAACTYHFKFAIAHPKMPLYQFES